MYHRASFVNNASEAKTLPTMHGLLILREKRFPLTSYIRINA